MNLTVFNGSPRGKGSNTTLILNSFLEGFSENTDNHYQSHILAATGLITEQVLAFNDSENIILAFPLYTDSMPGIVKNFIDHLKSSDQKRNIGFIIHSGFPEAVHCEILERYLKKLASRLNCHYTGTIVMPGTEGIQIMPPSMVSKKLAPFKTLGQVFGRDHYFDPEILVRLKKPYKFGRLVVFLFKMLSFTGLQNFYWNMKLKENQAYDKRFDQPYL